MKEIFRKIFRPPLLIIYVLVFSFLVRLAGIKYGLPLWLIDDEPPFTLAALKMIQLKTLLPVFHLEEFRTILYYPPYLSYLYLLPFSMLLGIKFLFFHGELNQFLNYIAGDLSGFFIIARLINIVLSTASIFLIYKISKNIFSNRIPALLGSFFLGTSLIYIMLSFTGRHWLPIAFLFVLIWFFLSQPNKSLYQRYFPAILTAGIGMGISPIIGVAMILILFWYIVYEQRNFIVLLSDKLFYLIYLIFGGLAVLPGLIYPMSFGFRSDLTAAEPKSFLGIIESPILFLRPVFLSEPALVLGAILGLILLWINKKKNLFWTIALFIFTYSAIFYWLFRYEHRFTLPLIPILAFLAGYGIWAGYQAIDHKKIAAGAIIILFLFLAVIAVRFSYLAYYNDSRLQLRNWAEKNLPINSKILVYARLTRLSSDQEAIQEQRRIDPQSLRKVDLAEENLSSSRNKSFHALNLYSVHNSEFYKNLENYVIDNQYQYLFLSQKDFLNHPEDFKSLQGLAEKGKLLKSFEGSSDNFSIAIGQLIGNPIYLFKVKELGPSVAIYKLQ